MSNKTLTIIFFLLVLVSCGAKRKSDSTGLDSTTQPIISDQNQSPSSPTPEAADTFKVNVKFNGFSVAQEDKIRSAIDLIKKVVASQEFKDRVIHFTFKGKNAFIDNQGMTNVEIYEKILKASETMVASGENNAMDLDLELYHDNTSVIGYTLPTVSKIWMNTKYFNSFLPYQISDNMFHEWLHKLGFTHDYQSTPTRPYSVPYAIGYIVEDIAKKLYQN